MRTDVVADSIGVLLITTFTALPLACTPTIPPAQRVNLQPLVATAGAYGIAEAAAIRPQPAPVPTAGCEKNCRCNGTGVEKSGDGLSDVSCRCPETCACKTPKSPTAGRPGWPPRNTAR